MLQKPSRKLDIERDVVLDDINNAQHPDLKKMIALWNEKRGEQLFPPRKLFTPRDMKDFLPATHLYETLNGGEDFYIRIVGTALVGSTGDPTGHKLSTHPDATLGQHILRLCQEVVRDRKPYRVMVKHTVVTDYMAFVAVESIWLPLGEADTVDFVLAQSILKFERHPSGS